MVYTIEVSFDIRVQKNVDSFKAKLKNMALWSDCESQYFLHEIEGRGRLSERNHCIFVVILETIEASITFLRKVREESNIYIECIYEDDMVCNIIHASPKYLQRMDKSFVKQYKKERKNRELTANEIRLLNTVRGK